MIFRTTFNLQSFARSLKSIDQAREFTGNDKIAEFVCLFLPQLFRCVWLQDIKMIRCILFNFLWKKIAIELTLVCLETILLYSFTNGDSKKEGKRSIAKTKPQTLYKKVSSKREFYKMSRSTSVFFI